MKNNNKVAFLTGITGQDGSYLAELLLKKNYEVHAILRRASVFTTSRIDHILDNPNLHTYHGDLTDSSNLHRLISSINPTEIYNLGAQSHVGVSFEVPEYTVEVSGIGTARLLDAIRDSKVDCKFYQASTSELFGGIPGTEPQSEDTPFYPKSPYGAAKLYAYWLTVNYRESYGMFACNGILFNHESPRRGETFVTRKITKAVGRIYHQLQKKLTLGNLEASRDWGFAGDYTKAMWLMLQQDTADDFVIASGESYSVRKFAELAFKTVNLNWEEFVVTDKKYFRPNEVDFLLGDYSKAQRKLNWKPSTSFENLVKMMVESDLNNAEKEKILLDNNLIKPTWENPV